MHYLFLCLIRFMYAVMGDDAMLGTGTGGIALATYRDLVHGTEAGTFDPLDGFPGERLFFKQYTQLNALAVLRLVDPPCTVGNGGFTAANYLGTACCGEQYAGYFWLCIYRASNEA
ncbi:hypothetical protein P3339_08210 [Microbulbifer sp. MLAF003]|uniref:hypothetical protein n=1 Tax=unclassified Microbulbifer TaxID=2619833 RepID=UPI0024AD86D0|nr:hypothetical protein [Microbulbifer sp. MLAF003]WHI52732.1 hypothetical protein P3339_08210 [Microbulbifer sp. MLAF003]